MGDSRRYRLRPGSVALTRAEWTLMGLAAVVGLIGLGLLFSHLLTGGLLLACAGSSTGAIVLFRGRFAPLSN